jgi:osmoprotectant transport system ATP-binding protein
MGARNERHGCSHLRESARVRAMSPTAAVTVEFQHVTKRYDAGKTGPGAVNDLSLSVPAGKICVLVGPSGCGKTTSLKMVNRLIEPTSGSILIDGRDAAAEDPIELRRRIGYVIQQVGLFPHLSIADNVSVVPRLLGWDRARQQARADELLELVGLAPRTYGERFPSQLSGGERQRVGVARALAADPPLMLMDEPFGAVDPIARERLQNEFMRLQADLAKTILFVTHDIEEAIKLGDLVAVIQAGGQLAQFGTPEQILGDPASDFVARFVGADRGLKRLSLLRVRDVQPRPAITARVGDDAADARARTLADPFPYLLLLDQADRPLGWIEERRIRSSGVLTAEMAEPVSPLLEPNDTLKEALARLLDAGVEAGVVIDGGGRSRGLLTFSDIGELLRQRPTDQATSQPARAPDAP